MPAEPGPAAVDALVVGAGPAGCAAAITLASAGWTVVMCARAPARDPVGESLSPAGQGLLARLGLPDLLRAEHRPCYANLSVWGDPTPRWHDYVRDPRGHGFHLDRARFEARLRERAEAMGVRIRGPLGRDVRREGEGWRVGTLSTRHVIDASGRAAQFARAVGARREGAWEQVALVGFARAEGPVEEAFTLVEAVELGFWYTAPIPGGRFAVALFTDAALHADRAGGGRFAELLAAAPHTRARLLGHGATLEGPPRFVEAGSARLAAAQGPGWVAVGDAAMSYDPVSAHGITLALRTGIDGAEALLAGPDGRSGYQGRLDAAFAAQRAEALRIFRAERRWPEAPYWRKRHGLVG